MTWAVGSAGESGDSRSGEDEAIADDLLEQIERIRRKLATVPQMAGRSPSFGEEAHGFRLRQPLVESQVRAFEDRHGVRLPEGYRLFLLHLGDGGAGPYYGVLPLERALDAADEAAADFLARPSPLVPGMARGEDWMERLGCTAEDCYRGAIALVEQGCTYFSLLVVTGPARGRVVNVDLDLQPPYFPDDPDFLSWYERWLDEMALGYDLFWFDSHSPGDEADLGAILADPARRPERRAKAVASLLKLPRIGPGSHVPLRSALTEGEIPELRASAAAVLGHFRVGAATPELLRATCDPAAGVRESALAALARIGAEGWVDGARRLLADPDADVRFRALSRLSDAGRLRFEDVRPLLADAGPKARRDAVYFLGKSLGDRGPRTTDGVDREGTLPAGADRRPTDLAPEAEQALRLALVDPDRSVKIQAIQAVRDLRPSSFLGVLEQMRRCRAGHLDPGQSGYSHQGDPIASSVRGGPSTLTLAPGIGVRYVRAASGAR